MSVVIKESAEEVSALYGYRCDTGYVWRLLTDDDEPEMCDNGCGNATWFCTSDEPMASQEWFCGTCASDLLSRGTTHS